MPSAGLRDGEELSHYGLMDQKAARHARLLQFVDIAGTFVLAIQGASIAAVNGLDALGVVVVSLATAMGGGIMRDLLIGETPPEALRGWPIVTSALIPRLSKRDSDGDSQIGVCLIQGGEQRRFAMPIRLRTDFDARMARAAARRSKDGPQARRLLALAAIYEGASRTEAAKIGGVTLQIVRDWVVKFNADGPQGLLDRKAPGQPPRLNDEHRAALAAIIESGPIAAVHGVVRWRIVDLCQWMFEESASSSPGRR